MLRSENLINISTSMIMYSRIKKDWPACYKYRCNSTTKNHYKLSKCNYSFVTVAIIYTSSIDVHKDEL